jgi:hypothetical protein
MISTVRSRSVRVPRPLTETPETRESLRTTPPAAPRQASARCRRASGASPGRRPPHLQGTAPTLAHVGGGAARLPPSRSRPPCNASSADQLPSGPNRICQTCSPCSVREWGRKQERKTEQHSSMPPLLVVAGLEAASALHSPLHENVLSQANPSATPCHRSGRRPARVGSTEPAPLSVREEQKGEGGKMIREVL